MIRVKVRVGIQRGTPKGGLYSEASASRLSALKAFGECWVRSIKTEYLDHLLAVGERHLDYLVAASSSTASTNGPNGINNKRTPHQ